MPRTIDEPEIAPPPTDWEREEQEKLPPRGDGSQHNQGDKKKEKPPEPPQPVEPSPDVFPSSELLEKVGPYNKTTS